MCRGWEAYSREVGGGGMATGQSRQSGRVFARPPPLSLRGICVGRGARLALVSAGALRREGVLARTASLLLGRWL